MLRPCCNRAIALNLFSTGNALLGKVNLHNCKRKCPKRSHYYQKVRGRTLGGALNLFLHLKVSDENNSQNWVNRPKFIRNAISLSLLTTLELKIGRMITNLVVHLTDLRFDKKINTLPKYGFLKFVILLIDSVLRSRCMLDEWEIRSYAINSPVPCPCQWGGVSALVDIIGAYQVGRGPHYTDNNIFESTRRQLYCLGMKKSGYLSHLHHDHCPGRFLGIIGRDSSVSKSNRLHVVIFRFFFNNARNIP